MRTTVLLSNCVTATLSTILKNVFSGLSIYSSPLISAGEVEGGKEMDCQHDTYRRGGLIWVFSFHLDLHSVNRVYNYGNYFLIVEDG